MTDHTRALTAAADTLEQARAARDREIIAAHGDGMKVAHIAAAARLSRSHVHRIIKGARDADD